MKSIRTEFTSMDPWETSVVVQQFLLQMLMVSPLIAGAGKSVLWYVDPSLFLS
jgi:hypothetical protein